MRKIGIIFTADVSHGGVYQYAQSMLDALMRDKSNDYVIFTNKNSAFDINNIEHRTIKESGNSILIRVARYLSLMFGIKHPLLLSNDEQNKYSDIDLFISPQNSPYPVCFLNRPYIFTMHDFQDRYYPGFFTLRERIIRIINSFVLCKGASNIIVESNHVKSDVIKFTGVDPSKVSVVIAPPPKEILNLDRAEVDCALVKEKYNLPDKYLFYPAQTWPHKNHLNLIAAVKPIIEKDRSLNIVLTGSKNQHYKKILNAVTSNGLSKNIHFLGYVDYQDLPAIYIQSEMLVLPTLFESISIPIYEAFKLGVPVCCSNAVALPDQTGDAAVLFDPSNIEHIRESILLLLNDTELRNQCVSNGYKRINDLVNANYSEKLVSIISVSS